MKIKKQIIIWLGVGITITAWFVFNRDYMGDPIRHFIMEIMGSMFALTITVTAFNISIEQREGFSPYIGLAFLAAGIVDMFHALFAMGIILSPLAEMPRFIAGTWTAGRTVLGAVLLYGIVRNLKNPGHRPSMIRLAIFTAGLSTVAMILFTLLPLPAFVISGLSLIHRPWELVALVLYSICLWKVYKSRNGSDIQILIVPSMLLGIMTQALMAFSYLPLFNPPFDGSHVLKVFSYIAMVIPLRILMRQRARYSYKISNMRLLSWFSITLLVITILSITGFAVGQEMQKQSKQNNQIIQIIGKIQNHIWILNDAVHHFLSSDVKAKEIGEKQLLFLCQFSNNSILIELEDKYKIELRTYIKKIHDVSNQIFLNDNLLDSISDDKPISPIENDVFHEFMIQLNRIIEKERAELLEADNSNNRVIQVFKYGQMAAFLLILPALFIVGIRHVQKQIRPILRLTDTVENIHKGNRQIRSDIEHHDEIGSLAFAFNSLLDSLRESEDELKRTLLDVEKNRDDMDGILKSISDGLIVTDNHNRVIMMNRIAEDMLNVRFSEVINRKIDYAIKEKTLRERVKHALEKKESGNQFDFELPGKNIDHPNIFRAQTSLIKNKEGKTIGIITIFHDVSHEREVDRMKTEFISTAAHELRTPLTSIQGFSEILLTRDNLDVRERKKFLGHINKQSANLAAIINDLLNICRIESGRSFVLDKEPCLVGEFIKKTAEPFITQSKMHKFEIVVPKEPVEIKADKDKMAQVLKNLINNAVKYSPYGGKIQIKGEMKKSFYEVSVNDEGLGMTPEQVEKIFDKFYRADATNTAIEGTGLGMSIVKHIVETHGGTVLVESEYGKGTKVTFTIPLN